MNKATWVLPVVIISLLTGIWTGWIRLGWTLPVSNDAAHHGSLMVNSFLASLIFLERAVTFKSKWILLIPAINGCSLFAFLFDQPVVVHFLFIAGSAGFVTMCLYFIYRFREAHFIVFLAGAVCLLVGNVLMYRDRSYPAAVTWWIGFLLFTIVAERLELSRFLGLTTLKRNLLWICVAVILGGLCWPYHSGGNVLLACSLVATSLWLLKFDMARLAIKASGQHRYSGILLIAGYSWLMITAFFLVTQNRYPFGYDALLHSFFIGFIFSMIFSHAVIILPAILKLPVKPYRPVLYVWFLVLQMSLLVRIGADMLGHVGVRKIAGLINGISILFFFISIGLIILSERRTGRRRNTAGAVGKAVPAS